MNSRLRLECLAAVSKVFREFDEPLADELLSSLVFALPQELVSRSVNGAAPAYRLAQNDADQSQPKPGNPPDKPGPKPGNPPDKPGPKPPENPPEQPNPPEPPGPPNPPKKLPPDEPTNAPLQAPGVPPESPSLSSGYIS